MRIRITVDKLKARRAYLLHEFGFASTSPQIAVGLKFLGDVHGCRR